MARMSAYAMTMTWTASSARWAAVPSQPGWFSPARPWRASRPIPMAARTPSRTATTTYERTGERRALRIGMTVHGSGLKAATTGIASMTRIVTTSGRALRAARPTAAKTSTGRPTYAPASRRANDPSGYHPVARFHAPSGPAWTNGLPKPKPRMSNGVAALAKRSLAESARLRTESVVRIALGMSWTAPTAAPRRPNPSTRGSVTRRGRVATMRTAAASPVRSHVFGWPASAWIPQATPARTRPTRVGPGRRTSGTRTQGIQP